MYLYFCQKYIFFLYKGLIFQILVKIFFEKSVTCLKFKHLMLKKLKRKVLFVRYLFVILRALYNNAFILILF